MLSGKRILLGVTGGIAAYKTSFLTRLLIKAGAEVRIVMTEDAGRFVSPLTLATLSKNEVLHAFVKEDSERTDWNNHVALGLWADLMLIAPATANTLSKMASGRCDNLLMAVYLSAKCPVFFAPAMDLDMYRHPTTKASIDKLKSFGNVLIPAEKGELASGLEGEGRMAEPEQIVARIAGWLHDQSPWRGKKVLITAGPTYEPVDPVRFIGNRSSGKMGYALAEAAAERGAQVWLVSGPTHLEVRHPNIQCERVETAREMLERAQERAGEADIIIGAAAVSDYRPARPASQKLKKGRDTFRLEFERNPDIIQALAENRSPGQFILGFALETENGEAYALEKLKKKDLDAIVLNTLEDAGAGFGVDTNKIRFIDKNSAITPFELKEKTEVARDILNEIDTRLET